MYDTSEIEERLDKELEHIASEMNRDTSSMINQSLLERLDKVADIRKDLKKAAYYETMCNQCCNNYYDTSTNLSKSTTRDALLKELDHMMSTIGSEKERAAIMKCFNELKSL